VDGVWMDGYTLVNLDLDGEVNVGVYVAEQND
jgi:hypothetical protein